MGGNNIARTPPPTTFSPRIARLRGARRRASGTTPITAGNRPTGFASICLIKYKGGLRFLLRFFAVHFVVLIGMILSPFKSSPFSLKTIFPATLRSTIMAPHYLMGCTIDIFKIFKKKQICCSDIYTIKPLANWDRRWKMERREPFLNTVWPNI